MKTILPVSLIVLMMAGVVAGLPWMTPVGALSIQKPSLSKPYYKSGDHKIIAIVRFDNNCWEEIYARAADRDNQHSVLNKQTVQNNDEPSNGPSEVLKLKWKFKAAKVTSDRIRMYVEIELVGGLQGETVTHYKSFGAGAKKVDFGVFQMHTDSSLCRGEGSQ